MDEQIFLKGKILQIEKYTIYLPIYSSLVKRKKEKSVIKLILDRSVNQTSHEALLVALQLIN